LSPVSVRTSSIGRDALRRNRIQLDRSRHGQVEAQGMERLENDPDAALAMAPGNMGVDETENEPDRIV